MGIGGGGGGGAGGLVLAVGGCGGGKGGQVLVAYRIPEGSAAPASISDDGGARHFSREQSYSAYMEETYPEAGMRWAGYVSEVHATDAGAQQAMTLSPEFPLPEPGKPF